MTEEFAALEQAFSSELLGGLDVQMAEAVSAARLALAAVVGTDGVRRFIKAGQLRNKAAVLHDTGLDNGGGEKKLLHVAEGETLAGATETMVAAGLGESYHYMATESLLVLTSALTYLREKIPQLQSSSAEKIRSLIPYLEILHPFLRPQIDQLCVSIGAVFLGKAFRMKTDTPEEEAAYQKKSIAGGALYALGSLVDAAQNPARIGQAISAWLCMLNINFSRHAIGLLMVGKKSQALDIPAGEYEAPLTDDGTINIATFERQHEAVSQAIQRATRGEKLSGEGLTRRIMAIRFNEKAIEVPLQPNELPDAIPEGQNRIVSVDGKVIFVSKDPYAEDAKAVSSLGPNASDTDGLNQAFGGLLALLKPLEIEMKEWRL